MSKEEYRIRFEIALDIIKKCFTDYCKNPNTTREEKEEFSEVIINMLKMQTILTNDNWSDE